MTTICAPGRRRRHHSRDLSTDRGDTPGVALTVKVKTSATPGRGGRPFEHVYESVREVGVGGGTSITWSITGGRRPPATPDGTPLVLDVSCPSGVDGRHEVTLGANWTMESTHDLVAERVLAAFGGNSPCLKLEQAVAAGRAWLEMELRYAIPRLKGTVELASPTATARCCPHAMPLASATAHARTIEHLAFVHKVERDQLREVVDAVATAYGIRHGNGPHPDEARAAQHCVNPPLAVHQLWDLGLSPAAIRRIYDAVCGRAWAALPRSLYEAVVMQRADLRWLEQTMQSPAVQPVTDAEKVVLAQWLVESRTKLDRKHPRARQEWLATGLPWHWILTLSEANYTAQDLNTLVAGTRFTPIGIAQILARWAAAGCHPTPQELLRMRALGLGYNDEHVSAAVVGRLRGMLADDGITLPDTALGLLFVAAGSALMAHAWVRAGVSDPFKVAELIASGETPNKLMKRSA